MVAGAAAGAAASRREPALPPSSRHHRPPEGHQTSHEVQLAHRCQVPPGPIGWVGRRDRTRTFTCRPPLVNEGTSICRPPRSGEAAPCGPLFPASRPLHPTRCPSPLPARRSAPSAAGSTSRSAWRLQRHPGLDRSRGDLAAGPHRAIGFGGSTRYGKHVWWTPCWQSPAAPYRRGGGRPAGLTVSAGGQCPAPSRAPAEAAGRGPFPRGGEAATGHRPAVTLRAVSRCWATNPCASAPCRTADNRRGSACCRDLQIEIQCRRDQVELERLVRHRKSPYLCKVEREGDETICAEMISACGYLDEAAGGLRPARPLPGGRQDSQTRSLFRLAPQGKGITPGVRLQVGWAGGLSGRRCAIRRASSVP